MNIKNNQFYVLLSIFLLTLVASIVANNFQSKSHSQSLIPTQSNMKTIIVDVRTPREWEFDGHANCSVNYPLDNLASKIEELKGYDKVILVCRSGGRASYAQQILQQAGIQQVENLGAWQNVQCK